MNRPVLPSSSLMSMEKPGPGLDLGDVPVFFSEAVGGGDDVLVSASLHSSLLGSSSSDLWFAFSWSCCFEVQQPEKVVQSVLTDSQPWLYIGDIFESPQEVCICLFFSSW